MLCRSLRLEEVVRGRLVFIEPLANVTSLLHLVTSALISPQAAALFTCNRGVSRLLSRLPFTCNVMPRDVFRQDKWCICSSERLFLSTKIRPVPDPRQSHIL